MILSNIYIRPEKTVDAPRLPFISLKPGERYKHSPDGEVSTVHFKCESYVTINRWDNWLVRCTPEMEIWNKQVIKV